MDATFTGEKLWKFLKHDLREDKHSHSILTPKEKNALPTAEDFTTASSPGVLRAIVTNNASPTVADFTWVTHAPFHTIRSTVTRAESRSYSSLLCSNFLWQASGKNRMDFFQIIRPKKNYGDFSPRHGCHYKSFNTSTKEPALFLFRQIFSYPKMKKKNFLSGAWYLICIVALCADGFKQFKFLSDTRSVADTNMHPLFFSIISKKNFPLLQGFWLSSHTVIATGGPSIVLEYIEAAVNHCPIGTDPYGRDVRIFVDSVASYGYFPVVAEMSASSTKNRILLPAVWLHLIKYNILVAYCGLLGHRMAVAGGSMEK